MTRTHVQLVLLEPPRQVSSPFNVFHSALALKETTMCFCSLSPIIIRVGMGFMSDTWNPQCYIFKRTGSNGRDLPGKSGGQVVELDHNFDNISEPISRRQGKEKKRRKKKRQMELSVCKGSNLALSVPR